MKSSSNSRVFLAVKERNKYKRKEVRREERFFFLKMEEKSGNFCARLFCNPSTLEEGGSSFPGPWRQVRHVNVQECVLYLKGGGTDTGFCRAEASGLTLQIRERVGPEGHQSDLQSSGRWPGHPAQGQRPNKLKKNAAVCRWVRNQLKCQIRNGEC